MNCIAMYPYNQESKIILQFRHLLNNYEIVSVITHRMQNARKKILEEMYCGDDLNEAFKYADALLLCDNVERIGHSGYENVVQYALQTHKQIIFKLSLKAIVEKFSSENVDNVFLNNLVSHSLKHHSKKYKISIPIISVMGLGENCDKFKVELGLWDGLKNRGYNVMLFGSNNLCRLFGVEVYPDFLFDEGISFCEKVIRFNHYLYEKICLGKPDIIILGCPGGIMEINEFEYNYFGETALIIANSVKCDVGIVCSYMYPSYSADLFKKINKFCYYRLNCEKNYFCVSAQEFRTDFEKCQIQYLFMEEYMDKKVQELLLKDENLLDLQIYNTWDLKSIETLMDTIVDDLSSNIDAI